MESWYQALLIPLKALGWVSNDTCIVPTHGITRKSKSMKSKTNTPVVPKQPKSISVHEVQGVFEQRFDISNSTRDDEAQRLEIPNTTTEESEVLYILF